VAAEMNNDLWSRGRSVFWFERFNITVGLRHWCGGVHVVLRQVDLTKIRMLGASFLMRQKQRG
jgi:hypothetical protein